MSIKTANTPPDLTVSIVSNDNLELLLPCLRSVFENTHHITLEVYLVDNASIEPLTGVVEQEFPQVCILRNEQRLGFSSNNNLVLERGRGRYLMLLNDDTLVLDGALDKMVQFMDTYLEVGAVGSFLLNLDRSFQPAFAYFPHPLLEAIWPSTNWTHRIIKHNNQPFEVDSVCGAAMLVRREVVDQVGPLDVNFDPLYSEEVEWCYRIKQAGWKIFSLPHVQIIHYGSYTMNRAVPKKYKLLLSHKVQFFRKHRGHFAASAYKCTLCLTTVLKYLWWLIFSTIQPQNKTYQERKLLHNYLFRQIPSF